MFDHPYFITLNRQNHSYFHQPLRFDPYSACDARIEKHFLHKTIRCFIQNFDKKIKELGKDITGMVGKLDIQPNSNQFVPSYVEGKIEIRTFTKEAATRCDYKQIIEDLLHACHTAYGVRTELEEIRRIGYPNPTGPAIMNPENIEKMEKICDDLGYSHIRMNKGTGHDSMIMADYVDTNMIYVPSRNGGVSHCPQEWTDYEDIQKGADVLLNLVKELSKK